MPGLEGLLSFISQDFVMAPTHINIVGVSVSNLGFQVFIVLKDLDDDFMLSIVKCSVSMSVFLDLKSKILHIALKDVGWAEEIAWR